MSYYIIGNVYRSFGFCWIVSIKPKDSWKFSMHGEFETRCEAEKELKIINKVV